MSESSPHRTGHHRVGVVMAGGHGERFWPLSRPDRPKQLLNLTDSGRTMLEDAVDRLTPVVDEVVVSTSQVLADAITPTGLVPAKAVLAEPARRSTLGALCWVVATLVARGLHDALVAVITADHMIGDSTRFQSAVTSALIAAEQVGGIVTMGIKPTRPETGYGYIETCDDPVTKLGGWEVFRSAAFREKPDELTAAAYFISGRHLWNAGMFFFMVSEFVNELEIAAPGEHSTLLRIADALRNEDQDRAAGVFLHLPDTSIDFALLEKAERVHVLPVDFAWDDVGAWDSLDRTKASDEQGNVTCGPAYKLGVTSSIVFNDDPNRTVALLGVQDIVVVNTPHAVLVCHKNQAQQVKQLVAMIAEEKRKEAKASP